jgi:hypothetical protein
VPPFFYNLNIYIMTVQNKNLIWGVTAGAALISAAIYLSKNNRLSWQGIRDTATDIKNRLSGLESQTNVGDYGGSKLAKTARQKAEQTLGNA